MANLAKKALLGESLDTTIDLEPEENTNKATSVLDRIRKEEVYENMEDIEEVPNTQETIEETKGENTEVPAQDNTSTIEETEEPQEVPVVKEEPKPKQTTSRRSRRASPKASRQNKSSSNIMQGDDLVTSIQLNIINQCREVFEKTQDNSELLSPIWDDIIRKIKGEN